MRNRVVVNEDLTGENVDAWKSEIHRMREELEEAHRQYHIISQFFDYSKVLHPAFAASRCASGTTSVYTFLVLFFKLITSSLFFRGNRKVEIGNGKG